MCDAKIYKDYTPNKQLQKMVNYNLFKNGIKHAE